MLLPVATRRISLPINILKEKIKEGRREKKEGRREKEEGRGKTSQEMWRRGEEEEEEDKFVEFDSIRMNQYTFIHSYIE